MPEVLRAAGLRLPFEGTGRPLAPNVPHQPLPRYMVRSKAIHGKISASQILMRLAYRPIEKGTIVLFILTDTPFAGRFERPCKQK